MAPTTPTKKSGRKSTEQKAAEDAAAQLEAAQEAMRAAQAAMEAAETAWKAAEAKEAERTPQKTRKRKAVEDRPKAQTE